MTVILIVVTTYILLFLSLFTPGKEPTISRTRHVESVQFSPLEVVERSSNQNLGYLQYMVDYTTLPPTNIALENGW